MTAAGPPTLDPGQLQFFEWYPGVPFDMNFGAGAFTDPQGLSMTYSAALSGGGALPSWMSFEPVTGTFSGAVPASFQNQPGTNYIVTVVATDSAGLSASYGFQAQVSPVLPPSQSNFIPTVNVLPGHSFSARMPADAFSDPQGLPMTYWASASNGGPLPSWLSFDPQTLTFSGTAPTTAANNYPAQLHATDSAGQVGTAWFTIYFTAGPPNLSIPTADQSWTVGQPIKFTLSAGTFTDPGNEALNYSLTGAQGQQLPSWLQFDPQSLTFSGTPPNSEAGLSLGIQVTASDTSHLSTTETFNVTFVAHAPPTLSLPTPAQSWSLGQSLAWTLPAGTFTDAQGLSLTYSAKSANGAPLPTWLKFDPSTHIFSGVTPTVSTALTLEVDATDSNGATTGDVFTATVGTPIANAAPPSLTDPTVSQGYLVGSHISLTLAADTFTDPQNLPLTYSVTQAAGEGPLPSWLVFDPAIRTFTGTVPAGGAALGIQVTATNSAGASATETFPLAADQPSGDNTVQLVASIPSSTWQIGQKIAITVPGGTFSDPQGLPLTYSASLTNGDNLSSWLTVDPTTGNISGIAPPNGESISVRITATDSAGYSGHDDFLLNVPAPYAPELKDSIHDQSWVAGQAIHLTLPSDSFQDPQGEPLTYTAAQSNGIPLPSWLHFDAATQTFSGVVPSTAVSLTVTVMAADASNLTGSETFAVTVSGTAPAIVETGVTAQQAVGTSLPGPVASVAVTDSAANVRANLDALQTLASTGILSSITLTDSGTPTLSLTAIQLAQDAQALNAITGSYTLSGPGLSSSVATFIVQQDGTANYPGVAPTGDNSVVGFQSATFTSGFNEVILPGPKSSYAIQVSADGVTTIKDIGVIDPTYGQSVTVSGENYILFNGTNLSFSATHSAAANYTVPGTTTTVLNYPNDFYYVLTPANAQLAQVYSAVENWEPQPALSGLEYWATQLAGGMSLTSIAQSFINTGYFQQTFGTPTSIAANPTAYVEALYKNILGLTLGATNAGVEYWVSQMTSGALNAATTLVSFTNATSTIGQINAISGSAAGSASGWLINPNVTGGYADPGAQESASTVLSQAASSGYYNTSLVDPTTSASAIGISLSSGIVTTSSAVTSGTIALSASFSTASIAGSGMTILDGSGSDSITITGSNNTLSLGNATTDHLNLASGTNTSILGFSPGKGSALAVSGVANETSVSLLTGTTSAVNGASLTGSGVAYIVNIGGTGTGTAAAATTAANAAYHAAGTSTEHAIFLGTDVGGDTQIWHFVNTGTPSVTAAELTLVATLIGVNATNLTAADLA